MKEKMTHIKSLCYVFGSAIGLIIQLIIGIIASMPWALLLCIQKDFKSIKELAEVYINSFYMAGCWIRCVFRVNGIDILEQWCDEAMKREIRLDNDLEQWIKLTKDIMG